MTISMESDVSPSFPANIRVRSHFSVTSYQLPVTSSDSNPIPHSHLSNRYSIPSLSSLDQVQSGGVVDAIDAMAFPDDSSPSTSSFPFPGESYIPSLPPPPSPRDEPSLYFSRSHSSPRTSPRAFVSHPSRLSVSVSVSSSSPSPSPSPSGSALSRFAPRQSAKRKKSLLVHRRRKGILILSALLAFFFLMNWWMFSRLQDPDSPPRRSRLDFLRITAVSVSNSSSILVSQFVFTSY
jgi:hypothetical protein